MLAAKITVEELVYSKLQARDVAFEGSLMPGRIAVESFALTTSGARVIASGQVDRRGEGAAVAAEVRLQDGDLDTMRRAFGLRDLPLPSPVPPTVLLARPDAAAAATRGAEVVIPIGTPGLDHPGAVFRTDGVVSLPVRQLRDAGLPSAARVLRLIGRELAAGATAGRPAAERAA